MRVGSPPGAPITDPIMAMLPSIFRGDEFLGRFLAGFDEVLAPVIATLDCLHSYVDPTVAPADFVRWLGGWVGLVLDEDWSERRCRLLVARAAGIYAARGTVAGLREEVALYTDGRVAVVDDGGVTTSRRPIDGSPRPPRPQDRTVRIAVEVTDVAAVNRAALLALVRAALPAHLPFTLELRASGPDEKEEAS